MIINTGMRTDIPAFYTPWLINRIADGQVLVRNPYDPHQVTRYSLSPDVVDLMAFCTKNPAPMLPHLHLLRQYAGQYWFVTITPYGRDIEPGVPPVSEVLTSFQELSRTVTSNCITWRYDPVFLTKQYTLEFHIAAFRKMAHALQGFTTRCIVSFLNLYPSVQRNFPEGSWVKREDRAALLQSFAESGRETGIQIISCAEGKEPSYYGISTEGCMTQAVLENALHMPLRIPSQKSLREGCNCIMGNDIGAYNSCGHLCRYCYANTNPKQIAQAMTDHDEHSPMLIGHLQPDDRTHEAAQHSWLDRQLSFF